MEFRGLEKLEERVLVSGSPYDNLISGPGKFTYEGDNGVVVVTLKGPVSGSWEIDSERDLFMDLDGTTNKTSVTIKGEADLKELNVEGDLKSFSGVNTDVNGFLDIHGDVKSVKLDDVIYNNDFGGGLEIEGDVGSVRLGDIGDGCIINVEGHAKSIRLTEVSGGEVEVGSAGSISVYGDFNRGYSWSEGLVKSFSVKGDVIKSHIFYDKLGSFSVKGNKYRTGKLVDTALVGIENGFKEGKFSVRGDIDNSYLGRFYSYSIGGNIANSRVDLGQYVSKFSVRGSLVDVLMQNSFPNATMKSLSVGGNAHNLRTFIGWNPGADEIYSTGDDEGFTTGNPYSPLSVSIGGSFGNSYLVSKGFSGKWLNKIKLGSVSPQNGGVHYGIFSENAGELIDRGRIKFGRYKYTMPIGDFVVDEPEIGTRQPPTPPPF